MSGSVRSQEPADVSNQNITLIRIIGCWREYFGLCLLNGKSYLFSSLGILFVWASSAQASSHKKKAGDSHLEKKAGDFSLQQCSVEFTTLKMSRHWVRCSKQMLSSLFPVLLGRGAGTAHEMCCPVPGSRCRATHGRRKSGETKSQVHFISP